MPNTPDHFTQALNALIPGLTAPLTIAVSGGPDSLALLLLAQRARPGHIQAATVDHALRPDSAQEAADVAKICAAYGIPHVTLKDSWHSDSRQGLQAAARAHRYRLLDAYCHANAIPYLLTAHHRDDQAETLLLRLARGAGLTGLTGVRATRPLLPGSTVTLVRPLLDTSRADLIAIVGEAGLTPVADPSNQDPRHDRTHARALLAVTPWLDPARLAATAVHLTAAETALAWAADREAAVRIRRLAPDHRRLDPTDLPHELRRRLVLRCLEPGPPPRGDALDRFIARLDAGQTAMLGVTVAHATPNGWTFRPAPPRRPTRNTV
ncbi:tRNA lysidine(34) synthetase TilS [Sphingomonas montana]|uniref:tRNA lysidine(34) synthetase TilS n=1 Tax=Sphingomonas montana TaxID=1843236 RepID=UPI00096E0F8B|nr:tRNA lysidine(34) synthetase TilS [Sphingomonas montana]